MANFILTPLYEDVYGNSFSPIEFSNRMKMQKLVYLLQEAGLSVGEYNFYWYKHGPYSQQLQEDILAVNHIKSDNKISYSDTARYIVSRVKNALSTNSDYTLDWWAECLASLQYLRSNIFSKNTCDEEIINELKKRKPHLNKDAENRKALEIVKELYN